MADSLTNSKMVVLLKGTDDIVSARHYAREQAVELGFSLLDQTKIVTAISELARNTIIWGGGGEAIFEVVKKDGREGLRVTFIDKGPGIPDIGKAMMDGYTTGGGLGLGLGGAKRLMDEFNIKSELGKGTTVSVVKYNK